MPQDQITPVLSVTRARIEYARAEPGYRTTALMRMKQAVKQELKRAASEQLEAK